MLWLFHYFQEKKMKTIILTVMAAIAISGCALFKENKTPLSPHGQLNACLRDEINQKTAGLFPWEIRRQPRKQPAIVWLNWK